MADGVCWEDLSDASLWIISFGHLRKPIIVVIVVGNDTTFDYGLFPADPPSASTTFCLRENETYTNFYEKSTFKSSPERCVESWYAVEDTSQPHYVPAQGVRCILHSSCHLARLDIWDMTSAWFQTLAQARWSNGEDCSGGKAQTCSVSPLLAALCKGSSGSRRPHH